MGGVAKQKLIPQGVVVVGTHIVDDHTVIGNKAGMVKPEDKNCGGVLSNVQLVGNELHGRIDIWSTKLIDEIDGNKRELSLCYLCDYKPQKGEFEGEKYLIMRQSDVLAIVK